MRSVSGHEGRHASQKNMLVGSLRLFRKNEFAKLVVLKRWGMKSLGNDTSYSLKVSEPDVYEKEGSSRKEGVLEHIKDPYSKKDQENFKKCNRECVDEKHHRVDETTGREPVKSYCTLKIFHVSIDLKTFSLGQTGYISSDGHHLRNPTKMLVTSILSFMDRSGSMCTRDCKKICSSTGTSRLRLPHDN
ncbi:3508_t:CDS:2 [Funneliformis caledonium]|uniref:3508_t:CDS:1 n=1 Tax=Funneliformis caledonium TaxID=1117310 RepID=A0A9N9F0Q5_9GLOM|nr:3508_t:CDS:2 [Funneliformis caledonium]